MSNHTPRTTAPVELTDFLYEPMVLEYRARKCQHVSCFASATQIRYRKDINQNKDKSSKTFVCEDHLTTTEL